MSSGNATTSGERANGVPFGAIGGRCRSASRAFRSSPHIVEPGTHATGAGPSRVASGQLPASSRSATGESTGCTRTTTQVPSRVRAAPDPLKRAAVSFSNCAVSGAAATSTGVQLPVPARWTAALSSW